MEAYEQQFEHIYDEYADAIFRHLFYRLGNRDRALELTQEVFIRFWSYLESGNAVEHPKAFLYRSARNAFINEIRSARPTVSLDALQDKGFEVAYDEEDKEELERQQEAVAQIATLDDLLRETLTLRYVDGLKVKEIAELLEEKENTISVRIKRGIEKLRTLYEP